MKIVYVLPISWGGIPHYTAELANALSKYADVVVLKPKDFNDELFQNNVKVINAFKPLHFTRKSVKAIYTLKNLINFLSYNNINLINDIKPDVIHFPELYPHSSIFAFLYRLHEKYPIVTTLHATFESIFKDCPYGIISVISRFTKSLVKPDKIIVHTEQDKNTLIKKGVNATKVVVIPHGAYTFFKKYSNGSDAQSNENSILFFGYIGKNKGIEYLIKAIPIVSQEIPDIKVIIAGEGDFSKYQKLIKDNSKFEIYNEFIPNQLVPKLFKRAKVIVLPYIYHQGHSGVLNIAFAFGKPTIVTNVGSLPDMVEHGKAGIVVPPKDSKALAEAIVRLLEDDKLRKKLSRNALKMAEKLSWDRIAKMHIKVYERVLEEKR